MNQEQGEVLDLTAGVSDRGRPAVAGSLPWGAIRLAVVVLGGLLVLQSSSTVDPPKLVYLGVAAVAFGVAAYRVFTARHSTGRRYRQLLVLDVLLFVVLGASFVVALFNRTPTIDWFRDVLGYALFATVPILAYDAAAPSGRRFLTVFLVVVGALASLSWTIEWLDRRGIADVPIDRLLLPAGHVAIALYTFALAVAMTGRYRPYAWAALAGAVLGMLLATGTRSTLVLLVAPLAMAVVMRPRAMFHTLRVIGLHLVTAILVFLGAGLLLQPAGAAQPIPSVGGSPAAEAPDAIDRIESLDDLATDPGSDPSVRERAAVYGAAWALFLSSPVIGVGPGHGIEWIDVSGIPRKDLTVDTPVAVLAKFGLVGGGLVVALVVAYFGVGAAIVRRDGWSAEALALSGFGAYSLVSLPLGMALEDKSFSFGVALLLALALSRAMHNESPPTGAMQSRDPPSPGKGPGKSGRGPA